MTIVVDTNIILERFLGLEEDPAVRWLAGEGFSWAAPLLWKSELCNVLLKYIRLRGLSLEQAREAFQEAENVLQPNTFAVSHAKVLAVATKSGLSAYDAEYLLLALDEGVRLVTLDRQLLRAAPEVACTPEGLRASFSS